MVIIIVWLYWPTLRANIISWEMKWSNSENYSSVKWNYISSEISEKSPNVHIECRVIIFGTIESNFICLQKKPHSDAPFTHFQLYIFHTVNTKKWNQIDSWKTNSDKCIFVTTKNASVECSTTWIYIAYGIRGRVFLWVQISCVRLSVKLSKLQTQTAPTFRTKKMC